MQLSLGFFRSTFKAKAPLDIGAFVLPPREIILRFGLAPQPKPSTFTSSEQYCDTAAGLYEQGQQFSWNPPERKLALTRQR